MPSSGTYELGSAFKVSKVMMQISIQFDFIQMVTHSQLDPMMHRFILLEIIEIIFNVEISMKLAFSYLDEIV